MQNRLWAAVASAVPLCQSNCTSFAPHSRVNDNHANTLTLSYFFTGWMLFLALANGVKHSRHAFNYFNNIYGRKAHFRAKIILHLSGWSIKSSPEVLCMAGSNCTVDLSTLQSQNLPTHTYQSYTGLRIDGTNIWCYSRKTVSYTSMCCCLTVSNHTCWSIIFCVSFWQYKNRIPTQPTRK